MTEQMAQSNLLAHLLTQVRASPLFGFVYDALPLDMLGDRVQTLSQQFPPRLRMTLAQGMPEATEEDLTVLMSAIVPKVMLFCALLALEEPDMDRLCASTLGFALMYWADQQLDGGDLAMWAAVTAWGYAATDRPTLRTTASQARLATLDTIDTLVRQISLPDDAPWLLDQPFRQFFFHAQAFQNLCDRYARFDADSFWSRYSRAVAIHTVGSIQLPGTIAMIHALYRRRDPTLPSLAVLFADRQIMPVLQTIGNVALRIFDDVGDQTKDQATGTLNVFTHPHPTLLRHLCALADIPVGPERDVLCTAWQQGDTATVVDTFTTRLHTRIMDATTHVPASYQWLLTLTQRFLAGGYVNRIGDVALQSRTVE